MNNPHRLTFWSIVAASFSVVFRGISAGISIVPAAVHGLSVSAWVNMLAAIATAFSVLFQAMAGAANARQLAAQAAPTGPVN